MKISKGVLYPVLSELRRVIDAKAVTPVIRNVHVAASGGRATLTATDLTTWLRCTVPCQGTFTGSVEPGPLRDIAKPVGRSDRDTEVEVHVSPAGQVVASSGGAQIIVGSRPGPDFPAQPFEMHQPDEWRREGVWSTTDLAANLGWVLLAAGHDETRRQLTGVFFDKAKLVATDGHRMHLAALRGLRSGSFLFPGRAMAALVRVVPAGGQVIASVAGDHVRFSAGDWELITKPMADTFPPYAQVVPDAGAAVFHTLVEAATLKAALIGLPMVGGGSPRLVTLRINGEIVIEREVDGALSRARVPVLESSHSGPDSSIGVDARYLADAISGGHIATARFGGELDPIRIELGDRMAVVMPARL